MNNSGGSSSTSSSSSSPVGRKENEKEGRPRQFDAKAKALCWSRADIVLGRHPERWRKDAAGNIVCKRFCNCSGCLCFEYDHIIPFSKGGESVADNCQILQTRVNRFKADKDEVDKTRLQGYSCDINFTGTNLGMTDPIYLHARMRMELPIHSWHGPILDEKDKELDIIEMAVYGDVIRPGNQCRCRTVAEMLGKYKSKDSTAACKLP